MSASAQVGAKPSPKKPAPISSATSRTSFKCPFTSSQVSCRVSSGAPESSNCPPGSSETDAPLRRQPMGTPSSLTSSQPKRVKPSSIARTLGPPSGSSNGKGA